ncbi:MAG: protein kinase domain-containing protein [Pseudomonadota bacterium]
MNRAAGPAAGGLSDLAADWPRLNALLDEALSLPAPERAAWLRVLPAEHAALKDTLARLLEVRAGIETGDFLGTLPKLEGAAGAGEEVPDPGAAKAGDEVGPYRLVRELGEGGMGSVWLAERADGQLKRQVALKLPRLSWARGLAERMARERDILATLEHPHIARLYDAGVDRLGRPWLALEYVRGRPIDEHARERALDTSARVRLLLQVCEAVAYAHGRLVIHRDLKPSNILVSDEGVVKLLDFGIAKLALADGPAPPTALTERVGRAMTLDYASPEQLRGEALTTSSDVYSLGVVAYELLAGVRPGPVRRRGAGGPEPSAAFDGGAAGAVPPSEAAARAAGGRGAAAARGLRGNLDAIVRHAMAPDAAVRYAGAAALADEWRRHLEGREVLARPDGGLARLGRWVQRHRVASAVAGALALLLVGGAHAQLAVGLALVAGALLALWQARRSRKAAERALAQSARADAMQRFVLDLFRSNSLAQPDPLRAQATTARELLEIGAGRLLEGEAGASPALRGELLDAIFGLVHPLRLSALAERLGEQRVVLRRQLHGAAAFPELEARADLAEVRLTLPHKGSDNVAELARLQRTLRSGLARGEGQGAAIDAGEPALRLLARTERLLSQALAASDPGRSLEHSAQAVSLLERVAPGSLEWAEACTDRVMPLLRAERTAEAERTGEAAVAALRGSGYDEALARAMVELAEARAMMRRHDEARALFAESLALRERRLGPGHPSSIYLLNKFATSERSAGRWKEAEALAALGIERCVAALGASETHYMGMLRVERGRCLVLLGRLTEACGELDAALRCLDAWGSPHFGHAAALLALATAHLGLNDLSRAGARCEEVGALLRTLGFGPGTANQDFVALLQADIAIARRDAAAASAALAAVAPPDDDDPGSPMRVKGLRLAALAAEVALLRDERPAALAGIEAALLPLTAVSQRRAAVATTPGVVAAAHETHARALLAAGRAADAVAAAACAVALRAAHEAESSVALAAARALHRRAEETAAAVGLAPPPAPAASGAPAGR